MELIGFSGKIGSGKDLAAQVVQYLNYKKMEGKKSFSEFEGLSEETQYHISHTQIEKFGGKLKDMVCILLNCTREDLENREFKEKNLGPDWLKYELTYTDKYSDCRNKRTFLSREAAQNYIDEQNVVYWYDIEEVQLTPRLLLQLMGTECGREILHPNIWVNAALEPYREQLRWIKNEPDNDGKFPNWTISDVRFPNEVEGIEKCGGIVIRIERGDQTTDGTEHESETALDDYKFDYVIQNNGTKEELLEKIEKIINKKFGRTK